MRTLLLLATCLIVQFTPANSQELGPPIAIISLDQLDLFSFDTKDQLFVSNGSGDIHLYGQDGRSLNLYSPSHQGKLQQLEASWTVNIFSFSADLQEYRILDRFLNPLAEKKFSQAEINLVKAATLGNNNIVWVWDESDLSLKSLDYLRNLVTQSQPLNLILGGSDLTVSEIREFKNRLFMNIPESGVFIFDNQANLIKKIGLKTPGRLCFYQEHLFWIAGDSLMSIDLDYEEVTEVMKLPHGNYSEIQLGKNNLALKSGEVLELYSMPELLKARN